VSSISRDGEERGLKSLMMLEFQDLWSSLKTPIADELAEELRSGQSPPLSPQAPTDILSSRSERCFVHLNGYGRRQEEERKERTWIS
jgi:hypothetical protein